ncbi:LacI family DNA-binding transcriptional regulator [Microbacterium oleivorans]|uniref:LacI family DNA-binding transcriptional regulator n=1 Tax=Microbacterium oleivorans TaxID=273677 RepID=UPI00203C44E4|nr:LacI family DNA-binding transcriptional regulator [Microbacterium oleivorans]MCM3697700.1 LacI family transcriptional regulator [Microbacterium oleivorans]
MTEATPADARGPRPSTIGDVAALAGVSRAAVSKVIRNAYGVSDAMRERVTAAIDELGYRPRVAARAMRGSTSTIGVQLPQLDNGFFTRILNGVMGALHDSDYHLIIAPMTDAVGGVAAIESLYDRQVDGIIAVAPAVPQEWLEGVGRRVPLVQIGQHDDPDHYDVVVGDDDLGARLVMEHLFSLGHERIAHVTNDERILVEAATDPHPRRLRVYESMMRERGLVPDVIRVAPPDADASRALDALLDRDVRPTALFAGHDALALSALRAAAERALTNAEFAIVGYDDIPLAEHPLLSLSTVDQSGEEMGATAARMLIERIRGREVALKQVFTPRLRVRASSGADHQHR